MGQTPAGLPYWEVQFDANGDVEGGAGELLAECPGSGATDLLVMSHGWNNAPDRARRLYERFFGEIAKQLPSRDGVATVGLIWPSMRWPDEGDPEAEAGAGGAASLGAPPASDRALVDSLKAVFPDRGATLDALATLLDERPNDRAALARFQELLGELATPPDATEFHEDNQEQDLLDDTPENAFARSARRARVRGQGSGASFDVGGAAVQDVGGAAFLGLDRLWDGAKQALRQTSYWEMKKRAGQVGRAGLGPLLLELHGRANDLRLHLIGHSFGARLVSFSLQGLGDPAPDPSPVKSLFLVQGAFSHYAFAAKLPHADRAGWLAGMQDRVDGPLVATFSVHDLAVGQMYPAASIPAGQDAAALDDWMKRWQAIGHDGAQAVDAPTVELGPPRTRYELPARKFLNLDGERVIRKGKPPSGAHSDIFHPELAWAAISAAGLAPR
jgi:hypothetical protein